MSESNDSYEKIIKSTSIFGGVQVFNFIISIIRSKLISVLIGTTGMGIVALLNTTINLIAGFTSLGIEVSAVKYISRNYVNGDFIKLSKILFIVKRIVWISGVLGALSVLILASKLSKITFGNLEYTTSFIWISITILFRQLSVGQLAILQGFQKLKSLAKANLYGSFFGLLLSIPFYYYLKLEAIVPAIIISSMTALFFSYRYSNRIKIEKIEVVKKELYDESKNIIFLGLRLSFSTILTAFSAYYLQIYIGNNGGLATVGLYNAGFVLLNSYVGLIFTSMATDYLPRLSAVIDNELKTNKTVLQQTLIGGLIITPIITLFMLFSKYIVLLLFSNEFLIIVPMVTIGALGMIFRVISFSIGYMVLIKADTKLFMKSAIGFNALNLVLNLLGYYYFGLLGLGIAFTLHYLLHLIFVKMISFYNYHFTFDIEFIKVYIVCFVLCLTAYLSTLIENEILKYSLSSFVFLFSLFFSLKEISKKINLISIASKLKTKIYVFLFKKNV